MKLKILVLLSLILIFTTNFIFSQYIQQGPKLVGSNSIGSIVYQGVSVAISEDGNTAVVNGWGDNNYIGAAWIFIRSNGIWTQQGPKIIGDFQSVSISSDGNTAVFGGGGALVYTRNGSTWTQQGSILIGSGGVGATTGQGSSVAVSSDGNTFAMGSASDNSSAGAIWVFTRAGNVWTQQGPKLVGTGGVNSGYQGFSVDISADGNTIVDGGYYDNGETGAIWIFTRSGNVWTQQGQKLVGSGAVGQAIQGFCVSISGDGNTAIESGYSDNNLTGALWVFVRSGNTWTQEGPKLVGSGATSEPWQGISSAISSDGNTIVDGGYEDNNGDGACWVFVRSAGVWTQQGTKITGSGAMGHALQGRSIDISSDGSTIITGGPYDNGQIGAAWVFFNPLVSIAPISSEIPKTFSLSQNYPNPFNPSTKIKFDIQKSSFTSIKIYDVIGKEISTLVNEQLQPGSYEISFDGSNYPSGVYFYKFTTEKFTNTKKMVIIK